MEYNKPVKPNTAETWLEQRRNYLIGGYVRAIATTAVMAYSGFMAGSLIGTAIDNNEVNNYTEDSEQIEQTRQQLVDTQTGEIDEANKNLNRISVDIGEACVGKINQYLDNIEAEEDSIVFDLLNNPTQPCGNDPTEIRSDIQKMFAASSTVENEEFELEEARKTDAEKLQNLEEIAEEEVTGLWKALGIIIGTCVGLLGGGAWASQHAYNKKYQIYHSREWMEYRLSTEYKRGEGFAMKIAGDAREDRAVKTEYRKNYGI